MTLKLYQQTAETKTISESFVSYILDNKIIALSRGFFIPDDLIAEIESFIERNSLAIVPDAVNRRRIHKCCERCLKAFALLRAEFLGLDKDSIAYLESIFDCEIGHHGFYLDKEEIIKI